MTFTSGVSSRPLVSISRVGFIVVNRWEQVFLMLQSIGVRLTRFYILRVRYRHRKHCNGNENSDRQKYFSHLFVNASCQILKSRTHAMVDLAHYTCSDANFIKQSGSYWRKSRCRPVVKDALMFFARGRKNQHHD